MNSVKYMTLEDKCLVNVALAIWKCCPKNKRDIIDFQKSTCWRPFQRICDRIIDTLELPAQSKRHLKLLIGYIGIEISYLLGYWKMVSGDEKMVGHFISAAHWTEQGVVDIDKVARELFKLDSISNKDKYILACILCFPVKVAELWEELTESEKSSLIQTPDESIEYLDLATIWSLLTAKQDHKILEFASRCSYGFEDIYSYMVLCAICSGCLEAVDYFWHKVPNEGDKAFILVEAIYLLDESFFDRFNSQNVCDANYFSPLVHHNRIMVHLFTLISDELLGEILTTDGFYFEIVMNSFLEWPDREHFMEMLDRIQPHFTEAEYGEVFQLIEEKIKSYSICQDCYYQNILKSVWKRLRSLDQTKLFESTPGILKQFFQAQDVGSCLMVLNDLTRKQKEEMIFSPGGIDFCRSVIYGNSCEMLFVVIEKCVPMDKLEQFQSMFYKDTKMHLFINNIIESKNITN